MSKVEDKIPVYEETAAQYRDLMVKMTEKKWLVKLLANKIAIGPLLSFL